MTHMPANFLARSRTAFSAGAPLTLEDVKKSILADDALVAMQRRDLASALNQIDPLFGRPLNTIHATASAIREIFTDASASKLDVSPKTLANIRSLIARAVRRYGGTAQQLTRRIAIAPVWNALLGRITVPYQRQALYRLAAYCSVMGISPEQVGEQTLLGLHAALEMEELVKSPRNILKNTISNWNRCGRTVPEWPQITLSSPFKQKPYTLPLTTFPESFQWDVAQWAQGMLDPDPLDPTAPPRPLRQTTVEHRILQFRQFASALIHRKELRIEEITGLATLFEPARFKSGLRFFLERQGGRTTLRLFNLANALRHVAKHHCRLDEVTLEELAKLARRLDPGIRRQMTPRNRERLRQFDDPRNVRRLLCFPEEQATRARNQKIPSARPRRWNARWRWRC